MNLERLVVRSVEVRPVFVPLKRPIVSKVGAFFDWPLILIDVHTEEGIVGRSYLEPYLADAANNIVPVIHQLAAARQGKPIRNGAWAVVAGRRHGRRLRDRSRELGQNA